MITVSSFDKGGNMTRLSQLASQYKIVAVTAVFTMMAGCAHDTQRSTDDRICAIQTESVRQLQQQCLSGSAGACAELDADQGELLNRCPAGTSLEAIRDSVSGA